MDHRDTWPSHLLSGVQLQTLGDLRVGATTFEEAEEGLGPLDRHLDILGVGHARDLLLWQHKLSTCGRRGAQEGSSHMATHQDRARVCQLAEDLGHLQARRDAGRSAMRASWFGMGGTRHAYLGAIDAIVRAEPSDRLEHVLVPLAVTDQLEHGGPLRIHQ